MEWQCGSPHAPLTDTSILCNACRLVAAAVRAVPVNLRRLPPRRTCSLKVLSQGRGQLAPSKQRLQLQPLKQLQQRRLGWEATGGRQQLARLRWQRACQAVLDARVLARSLELLANRLAPPQDRMHAAIQLKLRLAAYPAARQERLAWGLLARGSGRGLSCGDHILNELYITGGWLVLSPTSSPK